MCGNEMKDRVEKGITEIWVTLWMEGGQAEKDSPVKDGWTEK